MTKEWLKDNFVISMDKTRLNYHFVHEFLSKSYWAKGRTLEEVMQSIEHSICFGLYDKDQQIGFARIITDSILLAYLCDVFVLSAYQGQGLGKWLMHTILQTEDLKNISMWMLATQNAHAFYEQFNFEPLQQPERMLVRKLKKKN